MKPASQPARHRGSSAKNGPAEKPREASKRPEPSLLLLSAGQKALSCWSIDDAALEHRRGIGQTESSLLKPNSATAAPGPQDLLRKAPSVRNTPEQTEPEDEMAKLSSDFSASVYRRIREEISPKSHRPDGTSCVSLVVRGATSCSRASRLDLR